MSGPSSLPPGAHLGEKYEIAEVIGVGGMGSVYEGRHRTLGHRVAIKVLHDQAARDPEICRRFAREARAAAALRGKHVARVIDVDALPDGRPYIVMEHLVGEDLSQALDARGPFPIPEAVDLTLQACAAIAEAHARGIIHRDLKPGNLFLTDDEGRPSVKLLDFGISKVDDDDQGAMTVTATAFGTPLYMSPEQIRSAKHVDARSDVWSLAVILYELLTGETPFDGTSPTAVIAAITVDPPRPIETLRPEVPPGLAEAIGKALEKRPDDRHPSATAFAEAIAPFSSEGRFDAPLDAPSPSNASSATPRASAVALARTLPRTERPRSRWQIAAGVAVVTLGAAGIWAVSRDEAPPDRALTTEPTAADARDANEGETAPQASEVTEVAPEDPPAERAATATLETASAGSSPPPTPTPATGRPPDAEIPPPPAPPPPEERPAPRPPPQPDERPLTL